MFQCLFTALNLFLNMLQIMLPTPHQHACMRTIAARERISVRGLFNQLVCIVFAEPQHRFRNYEYVDGSEDEMFQWWLVY